MVLCSVLVLQMLPISKLTHPYGLDILGDIVFWTEQQRGLIRSYNLNTKVGTLLKAENPPLFDLKVFNNRSQNGEMRFLLESLKVVKHVLISCKNSEIKKK